MKLLVAILTASALAIYGCQGGPQTKASPEDSLFYTIPAGSRLTLNRPLAIPAGKAAVFLADGEIKALTAIDPYYPHCKFEVLHIRRTEQIVEADTFTVRRVQLEEFAQDTAPVQLAGMLLADSASPEPWATHLYLDSPRQPDVLRMSCQHWEDPPMANHLTVRQIRTALGDWFTLTLATE
ncbi:MAG: hypothetical protein JSW10_06830 [Pseudomonadota bacterium]|nr:MAG: hypothetical protein JSW10_06830 [Pseudomonadota bacterium]